MEDVRHLIELISNLIEIMAVATIFIGCTYALSKFLMSFRSNPDAYSQLRQILGKSILLGLEILIAADILATVGNKPTMQEVLVLGVIVLIRTFLSISMQVELEGRFPWQKKQAT